MLALSSIQPITGPQHSTSLWTGPCRVSLKDIGSGVHVGVNFHICGFQYSKILFRTYHVQGTELGAEMIKSPSSSFKEPCGHVESVGRAVLELV